MGKMNEAIFSAAEGYLGLKEYPGARHNETVVGFAKAVGHGWVKDDETPWCASFVGAVLAQVGLQHTGKLNARSYLTWGESVSLADAQLGDILVFWRGSPGAATGHVGFYAGQDERGLLVLGGNQGNKVSIAPYPVSRLLAVRRAPQPRQSVTETKTAKVSAAQVVAGAGSVGGAIAALDGQAQMVAIVGGFVLLAFGLWFFRNRLKDFAGGAR